MVDCIFREGGRFGLIEKGGVGGVLDKKEEWGKSV